LTESWLVTGALGCIGAWIARTLVREGSAVVGFDLGADDSRLRLIMEPDELARVTLVRGDVTELAQLERALDENDVTHVVHLAALLIPLARADPPRGALVNVGGTTNVFEAVKRRRERVRGLAYASSAAVYDVVDADAAGRDEEAVGHPATLYGVHKLANEGTARVYWAEDGVPSAGLRPYIVYGPGRDTGMTAGPTLAMAAAVRGEPYTIGWSSRTTFNYAPDVARAFVEAARGATEGALVYNLPGETAPMGDVVAAIQAELPDAQIDYDDVSLPFPEEFATGGLPAPVTPLADGVRETIELFRARLGASRA
jgi:nucleoside-diphosphate-sugar epimerase